jgi:RNA polymerase sigma factor (sigma-70 family)
MATAPATLLLHHVRRLAAEPDDSLPDAELLRKFTRDADPRAFATLLRRHGPMVWGACRRVLHSPHDAEDVFQATFLLLARKASCLRDPDSVGGWLYGVAHRLALRARSEKARRLDRERRVQPQAPADPLAELTLREAQGLFADALARLPERCRAALVLCHLEGATQEEAARHLGCSRSTLKRRLEEGRTRLRTLLARRGLTLAPALLAAALAPDASASVPAGLTAAVLRAVAGGSPGERVAQLLGRGASLLAAGKLRFAAVLLLGLAAAGAGLAWFAAPERAAPERRAAPAAAKPGNPRPRADAFGDPLPQGAVRRLGTLRFRQGGGSVNLLLPTRDGKTLVSKSYYGERSVCVWDLATGKLLRRLPGHFEENRAVALSPDGKTLALGHDDVIRLHDLATGREVRRLKAPVSGVEGLAFSLGGKTLASGHGRTEVLLWDVRGGKVRARLRARHNRLTLLAFSPDGKTLATGDTLDPTVRLFDVAGRREPLFIKRPSFVHDFAFSPDGKTLALGAQDGAISLWDPATGKLVRELRSPNKHVRAVAFSPDGKTLAASEFDEKGEVEYIRLWDPATGKSRRHVEGHWGLVQSLTFTADGKTLLSGGRDSVIRLWDPATLKERTPAGGHQTVVWWLALSPDGKTLAYPDGNSVRLWDMVAGRAAGTLPGHHGHGVFSPDGKTLAGGGDPNRINVWDVARRRLARRLEVDLKKGGLQGVCFDRIAFSPDGKVLASACCEFTAGARFNPASVRLWDPATGKQLRKLRLQDSADEYCTAEAVAFAPDGRTLIASGRAEPKAAKVRLWDARAGKELAEVGAAINGAIGPLKGPEFPRSDIVKPCIVFSPDGRLLAMNGAMKAVPVWESATGQQRCRLEGHDGETAYVAFSPEGRTLASAGYDGTIRLWDVDARKELRRLTGHRGKANALAFTPDGRTLISAGDDTTVLFWDVAEVTHRKRPMVRLTAKEWDALWADLAGADAARAHKAIARLSAAPGVTVPALGKELRPARAPGEDRLAKLLRELGSDEFAAREKAARELGWLGDSARGALERERARPGLSLELTRRLDRLLRRLAVPSGEGLRALRGVEVLERIGTPEARRVLEALAKGAPEARLTREAQSALRRLEGRPGARP